MSFGFVSNPGKMLTIWNRLHLCWGLHDLHDLHDLMTSWPLDKTGGLQLRGTCNCSYSELTNQGVDRQEPCPNFRVQFLPVPLTFCPMYHSTDFIFIIGTETELRRKSVLIPFRFRWLFHFIIGYIKDGVPVLLSFTEEHPRIGIAISKLVALLSPRRSSTW